MSLLKPGESLLNPAVEAPPRRSVNSEKGRSLLGTISVFLGALSITWPALYNGLPLLYPDSMDYIKAGHFIARALFFHRMTGYYGIRSPIYSLGILPFDLGGTAWPVVALQCLLTSFVVWLVVRSIFQHKAAGHFLVLMFLLSMFSSMSWYGSLTMPDILGPDLYLCAYLLVFAGETLSRAERFAVYLIAWWAIASHATHLLIIVALCLFLVLLAIFRREPLRRHRTAVAELAVIVALAVAAQVGLDSFLNGSSSLNGTYPPFVTARLVADGPGRWFLAKNCGDAQWEMCRYVDLLSSDSNHFLWDPDGVRMRATVDSRKLIASQEMSFAAAVLRAYPAEELEKAATNFWRQLTSFGLGDLRRYSTVEDNIGAVLPRERLRYLESRQARDELPSRLFTSIVYCVVLLSFLSIIRFLPQLWRSRSSRLLGLGFVIGAAVILNALVTGTLSMVNDRYESRLIWLVPFLAGLCALDWLAWRTTHVGPQPRS